MKKDVGMVAPRSGARNTCHFGHRYAAQRFDRPILLQTDGRYSATLQLRFARRMTFDFDASGLFRFSHARSSSWQNEVEMQKNLSTPKSSI